MSDPKLLSKRRLEQLIGDLHRMSGPFKADQMRDHIDALAAELEQARQREVALELRVERLEATLREITRMAPVAAFMRDRAKSALEWEGAAPGLEGER